MTPDDWIALGLTPKARFSFSSILVRVFDVAELRRLAKQHGTKPKGFRVEKATVDQLADAVAEDFVSNTALRDSVASELAARFSAGDTEPTAGDPATDPDLANELERKSLAAEQARERIAKLEQSAARATQSRDDAIAARRAAEADKIAVESRLAALLRDHERARAALDGMDAPGQDGDEGEADREEQDRLLEQLAERERQQRVRIAELSSRVRELENENRELLDLLPRGERERRRQHRKSYEDVVRPSAILPRFETEFFRSLSDLQPMEQRKVFAALARLVLYGPDYPGLHAKLLKGMNGLSSIRAADGLRVYVRRRGDDVTIEGCGRREQQDAYLRRRR